MVLTFAVRMTGGALTVTVEGRRNSAWHALRTLTVRLPKTVSVKIRSGRYVKVRVRATVPGLSRFGAARIVTLPD